MTQIEEILRLKTKPKEKQILLVESVVSKKILTKDFILFMQEYLGGLKLSQVWTVRLLFLLQDEPLHHADLS